MSAAEPDELDLFADTAVGDVRDPYPEYAEGRTHRVIEREHLGGRSYLVYTYDEADYVLRNPQLFSSALYAESMGMVMGPSILQMDGPEHVVHRGLVASAFRRKALEHWEHSLIAPTVDELIDRFAARGSAELVRELCLPYPVRIISKMLGIPSEDVRRFGRLSIELISITVDFERGLAASRALRDYFSGVVAERRQDPRDDVISVLATAEIDGHRLPDESIYGFLRLLLPAGAETTYRLLGSLLLALLTNTDQLDALRADRSLIGRAIEETLRWEAPVQFIARGATVDAEVAGVPVPAGAGLAVVLGSANRDETKWEHPERFDLFRDGSSHLAFAEGPHRCLGEHLARLETTVAVNALLDRFADLRIDPGDADPHVHGYVFRSPTSVPVRFSPA